MVLGVFFLVLFLHLLRRAGLLVLFSLLRFFGLFRFYGLDVFLFLLLF